MLVIKGQAPSARVRPWRDKALWARLQVSKGLGLGFQKRGLPVLLLELVWSGVPGLMLEFQKESLPWARVRVPKWWAPQDRPTANRVLWARVSVSKGWAPWFTVTGLPRVELWFQK